ncbi:hypothetical protein MIND_00593600 [Mycena indigotica]|uniref:Uncharacterized protein n=1 Tax=Mycena indigotica TaxID=2126181 RepID=A0A8H6SPV6_9AGAR|nr:uncharacterized protein MIND_00593600 [Mycena indigotica]KAF7303643.1 hypothetical protein MIND_00593600 [Mycena indigotica]
MTSPQASPTGFNLTRDAELLIQTFLPPSSHATTTSSSKATSFATPIFAVLESVDISQEELLAFIDGLNLAMTASPPLRVVSLAGIVIGFILYHWAMIAGAAIQTGAQVGMLSKTLTDRYLRAANNQLFKPQALAGFNSGEASSESKLDKFKRQVGSVAMKVPLPLAGMLVYAVAKKPPKVPAMDPSARPESKKLLATYRRVASLDGFILPLDFEMPKPAMADGVMDTMASWGVRFDGWLETRKQSRAEDKRLQLEALDSDRDSRSNHEQPSQSGVLCNGLFGTRRSLGVGGGLIGGTINLAVNALDRNNDRDNRNPPPSSNNRARVGQIQSGLAGLLAQRGIGLRGARGLQDREKDRLRMLLWVVIMNADLDAEIQGIERADGLEDYEEINEEAWRAEMTLERQEMGLDSQIDGQVSTQ